MLLLARNDHVFARMIFCWRVFFKIFLLAHISLTNHVSLSSRPHNHATIGISSRWAPHSGSTVVQHAQVRT